jgi:hypothetical protein
MGDHITYQKSGKDEKLPAEKRNREQGKGQAQSFTTTHSHEN